MHPTEPCDIYAQFFSKTAAIVTFKSPLVNPGAVDHYHVQVGGYNQKIEGGPLMNGEHACFLVMDIPSDQMKMCDVKVSAIAKNGTVEVKGLMKSELREVPDSTRMMIALSHRIILGVP